MISLKPLILSGREVWPLIEGSGDLDLQRPEQRRLGGNRQDRHLLGRQRRLHRRARALPADLRGKTRLERHEELIRYSIRAAISQARIAHDVRGGEGRLHMNVLWEMGACERCSRACWRAPRG